MKEIFDMPKKLTVPKALAEFLSTHPEAFDLDECASWVSRKIGKSATSSLRSRIKKALPENTRVIQRDDERWISRSALFQGTRFRISPTADEVEMGILFMGHRFYPFRDPKVPPWEYRLLDDDEPIPWTTQDMPVERALIYFAWTPMEELVAALSDEGTLPEHPEEPTTFRVWDLSEWYERTSFAPGDTIVVTVRNLSEGAYEIAHAPRERMQREFGRIRQSDTAVEAAILACLDGGWMLGDIETQLFCAFAHVDPEVLAHPGQHLGGLLSENSRIAWQRSSMGAVLCRAGEDVAANMFQQASASQMTQGFTGRTGSIDAILQDIGVSLSETMLRAMIRVDVTTDDPADPADLLEIIAPEGEARFATPKQAEAFIKKLARLCERIGREETTNPSSPGVTRLREKVLKARMMSLRFLRHLDFCSVAPEGLPSGPMLQLMEIEHLLDHALEMLEHDRHATQGLDDVSAMLDDVEVSVMNLTGDVAAELGLDPKWYDQE